MANLIKNVYLKGLIYNGIERSSVSVSECNIYML